MENNNVTLENGLDRKINVVRTIELKNTYNDAYKNELYETFEMEKICVYVERWVPTEPSQKLELYNGIPFDIYVENNFDIEETFKIIWGIIKLNRKNSCIEKFTKTEKKWLKAILHEEIRLSVLR